MVFRGYIDESYNDKLFTLSCLMTSASEWLWFERAWKRCLDAKNKELKKQDRKTLSRYHAADCSSRQNEFKGWTVEEQIEFTKSLLTVFRRGAVNVVAYSMPLQEFVKQIPECAGDPIEACYSELLKFAMLEMADQYRNAKVKFAGHVRQVKYVLFHDRGPCDAILSNAFNAMICDPGFSDRHLFSTLVPLGWEDCIPLQAADLIAYESFKESERTITGRKRRKTLELLMELKQFGGRSKLFDANSIALLREALDNVKRIGKGISSTVYALS